jgi:hypothetical protein
VPLKIQNVSLILTGNHRLTVSEENIWTEGELNIRRLEKMHNKRLHILTLHQIIRILKSGRMRWEEHVASKRRKMSA